MTEREKKGDITNVLNLTDSKTPQFRVELEEENEKERGEKEVLRCMKG